MNDTPNLESAALLTLLRAPGARWQQIAHDVEEAGSALLVLLQGSAATQSSLFDPPSQPPDLSSQIADLAAWVLEGISVLTVLDADYPENLRTVYDRPPLVFVAETCAPRTAARSQSLVPVAPPTTAYRARGASAATSPPAATPSRAVSPQASTRLRTRPRSKPAAGRSPSSAPACGAPTPSRTPPSRRASPRRVRSSRSSFPMPHRPSRASRCATV